MQALQKLIIISEMRLPMDIIILKLQNMPKLLKPFTELILVTYVRSRRQ